MTVTDRWQQFEHQHKVGERIEGVVSKITDFGLMIDLQHDVFGIVHLNDIAWENPGMKDLRGFHVGEKLTTEIISIDTERERISLGLKRLRPKPGLGRDGTPDNPAPAAPKLPNSPIIDSAAAKPEQQGS